jgi:hypothetical protein
MTVANTFASKALVAVVAAAMIFSAFVTPAKAATAEELQKMINDLMAQMAALQGGSTTGSSAAGVCPYTWTRDLKTGATGADVQMLQKFLNANADTRVAATGAGSAGMETTTFGPATAAAVSKFQVMHRADILTPAGLTNPTGFFGPSTRAKANALCVASTGGDDEDEDDDTTSGELSGEASLDDMTLDSASDDEIEEGEEEAPVAEAQVTFQDGDASISRIDVTLSGADDVWDAFDTVSLWVDGDMVAEMDASDEDEYLDTTGATGTLRFSGLDIVAMEDEDLDITVAATLQGDVDTLGTYYVAIDAIRFFDADGVATTEDADLDFGVAGRVSFEIVAEGADDEIVVKASANDPDATTLKLEDDAKSDWYNVFSFDLDTDDSTNDIELNTVDVTVELSSSTYAAMVDDAELEIDGTTIDDVTVTATSTNSAILSFDVDGDVTIDAGDRVEAKLMLKFKSLALGNEGVTVKGYVSAYNRNNIDAEGADDVTALSGAATGDTHTLRTTGVDVSLDSDSAVVTAGDTANDDYATYKLVLEVTAFEQDVFISTNPATSVDAHVYNAAGAAVASTTETIVIDSSADVEGGSFKIAEGETETVTITVTFDAASAGAAGRLQLNDLTFGETDGANNQTWLALPATDYRTDIVTLVN